tara:strand:+ start:3395 stop:4342 length:948 start_codon:yes stop_codon:yes gene_type:complete
MKNLPATLILLSGVGIANAEVDFEKEILPLLEKSCISCHKAPYEEDGRLKKPKAGLRFDGAWAIMAGGENGKVLEPGDPGDSEMYWRTTLEEDDDDFMPPKGDKWTDADKKLVFNWIKEGAKFGGWEGSLEGKPTETKKPEKVYVSWIQQHYEKLAKDLKPAPKDAIGKVEENGGRVTALAIGNPLLRVDFIEDRDNTTDEHVAAMGSIGQNIAQIDLSRTQVTDAGLKYLGEMPRLTRLDLHSTKVTDSGIKELASLKNLTYLNLYDTEVSDAALSEIAKIKSLKNVYLWKSKVTPKGAATLQKELPEARINWK